jgi:release factor H-coupled RctB family protein
MTLTETNVRLFASAKSWIESAATDQLCAIAKLDDVRAVVGFPDLHPGKGGPVGAAFTTGELLYPHLIGGDIGCGMALFSTDLERRKAKLDRWAEMRFDLELPWAGDVRDYLPEHHVHTADFDDALGTVGGGNHFAELQAVEKVHDAEALARIGLSRDALAVFVHSGSRGLGERLFRSHVDRYRADGISVESDAGEEYLRGHNYAVRWARANRALIAERFATELGATCERVWDGCHNSITRINDDDTEGWLHRKGAAPADGDVVVIAGSRGALTYIVKPLTNRESHAWSLAHGAGRKWSRSETRQRMRERFSVSELVQTSLGGRVVCEERDLLYEEAPAAYKNIDTVIQDLVEAGLVSVIATMRPLLTYKTRGIRRY